MVEKYQKRLERKIQWQGPCDFCSWQGRGKKPLSYALLHPRVQNEFKMKAEIEEGKKLT